MQCPSCHANADLVIDSRENETGTVIRRRRACGPCTTRFTTYETVINPRVVSDQRAKALAIATQLREMAATLEDWSRDEDEEPDEAPDPDPSP